MYTDLQSVASPLGHSTARASLRPWTGGALLPTGTGRDSLRADDGIRTRDPHLGKVMLYQLSHVRARLNLTGVQARSRTLAEPHRRSPNIRARRGRPTSADPGADRAPPTYDPVRRPRRLGQRHALRQTRARPTVPATDHGLVVGDGVFEALKVTPAGAFAVRRHLDRLTRSADALDLPAPDHGAGPRGDRRGARRADLRPGQAADHLHRRCRPARLAGRRTVRTTLVVAAEPIEPTVAATGTLVTAPWRRNEHGALTGVKSTSYAENVRGLAYAAALRRHRGDLPQHRRQRLRRHRHQPLLRLRRPR